VSLVLQHEDLALDSLAAHLHSHVTSAAPPLVFPLPSEAPPKPKTKLSAKRAAPAPASTPAPALLLAEAAELWHALVPALGFPLAGGPYLVTQAAGGCLTHATAQTRHAVDLACPRGTPVLAVADAEVVSVHDGAKCQGAHTANLFEWNSVLLRVSAAALAVVGDGPVPPKSLYVEYVHLAPESLRVRPGDRVRKGQPIALSGAAGFCPQPHLHIQVQASSRDDASTIPFAFEVDGGKRACVPAAGTFLSAEGPVDTPEAGSWMGTANVIAESTGGSQTDEDVYCEGGKLPYWAASIVAEFLGDSR
jgi:murein DD-endopeptidase MepM/ murein hydrolase activator NlpD